MRCSFSAEPSNRQMHCMDLNRIFTSLIHKLVSPPTEHGLWGTALPVPDEERLSSKCGAVSETSLSSGHLDSSTTLRLRITSVHHLRTPPSMALAQIAAPSTFKPLQAAQYLGLSS
jgi:hypothetical protein